MLKKKDITTKDLASLVILRLEGTRIQESGYIDWLRWCVRQGCGGFIIFGGIREPVRSLISHLQELAETPLFIASDIEWGLARQIEDTPRFPCQMAMASALYPEGEELLSAALGAIAKECAYLGINMPLIPVLDVNRNPDNPIIATRAFSDKPEVVSWFVERYIKAFKRQGLIITGKHFPGHGDTSVDSHIDMPVIDKTADELRHCDLVPFIRAVDSGIDCIMIGHLHLPYLDDVYPASLSSRIITNLLREEIGFKGLVITDAMNMMALKGYGDIYARCLMAGADIILHPDNFQDCLIELQSGFDKGLITAEAVKRALANIARTKSILSGANRGAVDFNAHIDIAASIYGKSITAVKSDNGAIPLSKDGQYKICIAGEFKGYDITELSICFNDVVFMDEWTQEIEADIALVALFSTVSAWHGTSGISPEARRAVKGLIGRSKKSVVISFGSPYVLRFFSEADVLISAYEPSKEAQRNVIECLYGRQTLNQNLPVDIKFEAL